HTAKFGAYYEYVINNQPSNGDSNGRIVEASWAGPTGNPYADLIRGYADQYEQQNKNVLHNEAYKAIEFFAMDSWKVTKRLTVDYGLRASHLGGWYDRQGIGFAIWNPALYVPGSPQIAGTGFDWHQKDSKVALRGFLIVYFTMRRGSAWPTTFSARVRLSFGAAGANSIITTPSLRRVSTNLPVC